MKKIIIGLMLAFGALSIAAAAPVTSAWESPARPKKTETVTFKVGMHCRNCVNKIQENIAFEKGVKDLKISLENKTVTITFDPSKTSADTLESAIRKLGYSVEKVDTPAN